MIAATTMLSLRSLLIALMGMAGTLAFSLMRRRRRASKAQRREWKDPQTQCEAIYHHLCCYEFPWECFYGINFAFYRTFASPSIAQLYHSTGHIVKTAGKRVADTDIMMHAWIDFGIDSPEGRESWEHLNRLHAMWKKRMSNEDFVYVLCCFIVDTIRFIDVFGWRQLSSIEREALYHFWAKLGRRMEIKDIPYSLEEAKRVVEEYVASDARAADTSEGHHLTEAMTDLLCQWYWFLPRRLVRSGASALLFVIGGPTFVRKLGLSEPSPVTLHALLALGHLRSAVLSCLPMRTKPRRLSEILMQAHYPLAMATSVARANQPSSDRRDRAKLMDFSLVGPVGILSALEEARLNSVATASPANHRSRSTTV